MTERIKKNQAKKFVNALKDLGINQKECAALIDRTAQTINNYARGHTYIHSTVFDRLENFSKYSSDKLREMARAAVKKKI